MVRVHLRPNGIVEPAQKFRQLAHGRAALEQQVLPYPVRVCAQDPIFAGFHCVLSYAFPFQLAQCSPRSVALNSSMRS